MPSKHLILCHPLLLPQSFLASGSFPVSQFFTSGGQSTGASASVSVLPMNIQGWFPLGLTFCFVFLELTGLILQSKDLSRVFSSTTVWKHQFFRTQPSLWFSSHILTILKVISSIVWLQALTIPVMLSKFKTRSLLKGGKAVLIGDSKGDLPRGNLFTRLPPCIHWLQHCLPTFNACWFSALLVGDGNWEVNFK